jgi:CBS domain-containing protein
MFATDTGSDKECNESWYPSTVREPEDQKSVKAVSGEGSSTYQLRTLIPQKDTYPVKRWETEDILGVTTTDKEGDHSDDHNSNASNMICENHRRLVGIITHVQLVLAMLARACPPSMQPKVQKPTPLVMRSRLGSMTP